METIENHSGNHSGDRLGCLSQKLEESLIRPNSLEFQLIVESFYLELIPYLVSKERPRIILAERQPIRFLAGLIAACTAGCPVFLCNPDWGKQEWEQVFDLVQPDIVWGEGGSGEWGVGSGEKEDIPISPHPPLSPSPPVPHSLLPIHHSPLILIPTGGSSGKIKFAIHTWETLTASVRGFTQHFRISQVNSLCVLPLYHVSGLMQFMRCFITGGQLMVLPFKELEFSKIHEINASDFFISLVPTQLQRLLQNPKLSEWLSKFQAVLLGGAPAWDELIAKARANQIPLALTYGMTETASQIATLKPDDFFQGKVNSGSILPHAQVVIYNEQDRILSANKIGNIAIKAESLALGYYPDINSIKEYLRLDDLGYLDEEGYLHVVGRNSDKIITGGENVYPVEIESAIRETKMVEDVYVIGVPDRYWGQAVTAIYTPCQSSISSDFIQAALKQKLSKFKIPKYWICLSSLPRNSQGKINKECILELAVDMLGLNVGV